MHRRHFVRNTSFAFMGVRFGGISPFSFDSILGHGPKKYQLDKSWSRADATRYPVRDCHEMVQDKKGRLFLLTNETKNNLLIYDKKGRILESWGAEYPGAHGLTLWDEGGKEVLFICDNNRHQVIKTDLKGKVLLTLDYPRESELYTKPEEYIPTETAIAPNGDIYVADGYGKDFILRYDAAGRYLGYFGGRGAGPEHLLNAHGICIDSRSGNAELIVTSRQEQAFKRYSLDGKYLSTVKLPGAWVCRPVVKGNYLYAAVLQTDSLQGKGSGFVTIIDKDWKVVSNPGGNEPVYENGNLTGLHQATKDFVYPHDVCIDDEGALYVAQWNSGKVYPYKLSPVV